MTTKVTFLAFVRIDDSTQKCVRVSSRNVERISDVLEIAKNEFFDNKLITRVLIKYMWEHEYLRCVIEKE